MAATDQSLESIKAQIVEPLEQLLRVGTEKEQALREKIEQVWDDARAEVAELRDELEQLTSEMNPAISTLRKFDPDNALLPQKEQKPKPGRKAPRWNANPEHVQQLQRTLEQDGQLTANSALAVLKEKFGVTSLETARNVLTWMREHELIRQGGTVKVKNGQHTALFKPMLNGDEPEVDYRGITPLKLKQMREWFEAGPEQGSIPGAVEELGMSKHDATRGIKVLAEEGFIVPAGTVRPPSGQGASRKLYALNNGGSE